MVPTEPARGTAGTRIGLGIERDGLFVTALVIALIVLVLVVGAVTLGRRRSTA